MPKTRSETSQTSQKKTKSPRCSRCGKRIHVPQGWTVGPAVRRHYWAKHRDVMTGGRSR